MDRQPADLPGQRAPKRVAHRRIDLAGDLGDRDAVGHGQVELDLEPVVEAEVDPRLAQAEPAEEALESATRRTR